MFLEVLVGKGLGGESGAGGVLEMLKRLWANKSADLRSCG
jgi:hypothetical protein